MRNLFRFIIQFQFIILFFLIESLSLFLLFNSNPYQKFVFYKTSHSVFNRITSKVANLKDYLSLFKENSKLVEENTKLYNELASTYLPVTSDTSLQKASENVTYHYIPATVINNSIHNQYNYITIDKGSRDSIGPEMAVIGSEGVVGITKSVSRNFTVILPALNRDFIVSGKIKKNGYYGPVSWNGNNSEILTLVDIPFHVSISVGDTVVTSGYGGIFPEGYLIGVIDNFQLKGGNYYEINVRIATDFRNLNHVEVIKNLARNEIDSLQNVAHND